MKVYYNSKLKELARDLRNHPTFAERNLWTSLKGFQLKGYDFHRQKPVGDFICDFYCFPLRLVIEVDGATHSSPEVIENDRLKKEYIRSIGFNVLRFSDEEVLGNRNAVVERIWEYIDWFERTQQDLESRK